MYEPSHVEVRTSLSVAKHHIMGTQGGMLPTSA